MSGTAAATRSIRKMNEPIEHPIRTKQEYAAAVGEMDELLDSGVRERTPEYDRLELLSVLVAAYEDEHVPELDFPTPQAAVRFMMEQKGVTNAELAKVLGGRSRLSEFLNERRELSRQQIRRLREWLDIPADLLIGD